MFKKNINKIINTLLVIILLINVFFNTTIKSNAATLDFTLTPNTNGYGSVSLNWSNYDYTNKNFKVYKSTNGGTSYETVGIDYTLVTEVKVLNIYPATSETISFKSAIDNKNYTMDKAASLKMWMEKANSESSLGYGKGIIKVDAVSMANFNTNPANYLFDSNGDYKYNVIVVGFWDMNGSDTFSNSTLPYIEAWIKSGRGLILGHDTIANYSSTYGGSTTTIFNYRLNFIKLQNYFNIKAVYNGKTEDGVTASGSGTVTTAYITKKGLITNYPWSIGNVGTKLTIPACHTSGQIAYGDVWMSLGSTTQYASDGIGVGNPYVTTYNNCGQIQTGHSNGAALADEQKVLANLIFYLNQLLFNTYTTNDNSAQDLAAPNTPTVVDNGVTISYSSSDLGSKYYYYVESYSKNDTSSTGLIDRSTTKQIEVKTGLKSYRYIFDNSASTTVTLSNGTETTSTNLTQPVNIKYFHVAAVDKAGNISATKTIELDPVWTLTTTAGTGGLISYGETIENGKSTSVHIVPMSGYQISTLTVDGASKTPTLTYDFWNVTTNHSVVATFTKTTNLTNYLNALKSKYSWISFK